MRRLGLLPSMPRRARDTLAPRVRRARAGLRPGSRFLRFGSAYSCRSSPRHSASEHAGSGCARRATARRGGGVRPSPSSERPTERAARAGGVPSELGSSLARRSASRALPPAARARPCKSITCCRSESTPSSRTPRAICKASAGRAMRRRAQPRHEIGARDEPGTPSSPGPIHRSPGSSSPIRSALPMGRGVRRSLGGGCR